MNVRTKLFNWFGDVTLQFSNTLLNFPSIVDYKYSNQIGFGWEMMMNGRIAYPNHFGNVGVAEAVITAGNYQ